MKIGIDARMLGSAQGGLGRYIEELIIHLEKIDKTNQYVIFLRKENWQNFDDQQKNLSKVLADFSWYGLAEQIKFKKIITKEKIDLMHFPHWNVPFFYNKPFIITIHDLILIHFPNRQNSTHGRLIYKLKYWSFKKILQHALTAANTILVPSEFVKKDLINTLHVQENKILVTNEGITKHSKTIQNNTEEILKRYKINKPYLLYVGVAYPHKNIQGLITYFNNFVTKYSKNYQLILVGKKNYFYNKISSLLKKEKNSNTILTDFIPDSELPAIYQNATALIYPSLYEGFGLPPLEAMSYGTPVLASNASCLPEILGDAALYFNPTDIESATTAIFNITSDNILRQTLIEKGFKQIQKYSWENCAQLTLQAYKNSV